MLALRGVFLSVRTAITSTMEKYHYSRSASYAVRICLSSNSWIALLALASLITIYLSFTGDKTIFLYLLSKIYLYLHFQHSMSFDYPHWILYHHPLYPFPETLSLPHSEHEKTGRYFHCRRISFIKHN